VTLTGQAGNPIIAPMADAVAPGDAAHPIERRVLRLVAAMVLPMLALAWLSRLLLDAALQTGATRIGSVILELGASLGVAAGGVFTAGRGGAGEGSGPLEPQASGNSVESLRAMVADQAAVIARYEALLEETRKELEVTQARLKETSFKDELTGLYNRRFFFVRLEEEISRHRRFNHPVAVVLFDLDGFKEVNDGQGHMIGDETLRDIGQLLTKYSRGINVVARYGGDEFAILLVETSTEGARLYAERIRQIISAHPYSHGLHVTASFGVASLPEDEGPTADELFRAADEALYAAKRAGKNQVAAAGPGAQVG
jgi:diguanylate cyclase (GGDEF)-like protein